MAAKGLFSTTMLAHQLIWGIKGNVVDSILDLEHVHYNQPLRMENQNLIGRVFENRFNEKSVKEWMNKNWENLLGYSPNHYFLSRGLLDFSFHSIENSNEF